MREFARYRGITALLVLGLLLAEPSISRAQAPAPAAPPSAGTLQIATETPRRPRRPPLDPAARELRQTRGIFAGGIVFTAVCGAGFGLFIYAAVDARERLHGAAGGRTIAAGGALLSCTIASIAAIGVGGRRLQVLGRSGRVAWTGGLGLRF